MLYMEIFTAPTTTTATIKTEKNRTTDCSIYIGNFYNHFLILCACVLLYMRKKEIGEPWMKRYSLQVGLFLRFWSKDSREKSAFRPFFCANNRDGCLNKYEYKRRLVGIYEYPMNFISNRIAGFERTWKAAMFLENSSKICAFCTCSQMNCLAQFHRHMLHTKHVHACESTHFPSVLHNMYDFSYCFCSCLFSNLFGSVTKNRVTNLHAVCLRCRLL